MTVNRDVLCVIPARGGSKRLPRKNALNFEGKPLVAYSIQAALNSELFDCIYVNTEDEEIKQISNMYGAKIYHRPLSLATDQSRVVDVCEEMLDHFENEGTVYSTMLILYATTPMITGEDLKQAYNKFMQSGADSCMAVSTFTYHPWQALYPQNGWLQPYWGQSYLSKKSQDFPDLWVSCGAFYIVQTEMFKSKKSLYGDRLIGYPLPNHRAVNIDVEEDFKMARLIYRHWDSLD